MDMIRLCTPAAVALQLALSSKIMFSIDILLALYLKIMHKIYIITIFNILNQEEYDTALSLILKRPAG